MKPIPFQPPGHPIAYFPSLSPSVGGSTAAVLLCQLIYWTPRAKDPDGWIYKTQLEIVAETGLTRDEQRSARKALKSRELIAERYDRLAHQLYFQVQMDAYNAMIQNLYESGEGDEDGPKPWKINQIRKTYMGKYGNRISRYTEIVRRHIRKADVATTSSEIPETTAERVTPARIALATEAEPPQPSCTGYPSRQEQKRYCAYHRQTHFYERT